MRYADYNGDATNSNYFPPFPTPAQCLPLGGSYRGDPSDGSKAGVDNHFPLQEGSADNDHAFLLLGARPVGSGARLGGSGGIRVPAATKTHITDR